MPPRAGESGAGGGLLQSGRKPFPAGSDSLTPAGVLGQKGRGATVGLNGWKKEEVVSARLPALTPSSGLSRQSDYWWEGGGV